MDYLSIYLSTMCAGHWQFALLQRDLEAGQIPVAVFKTALIAECKEPLPNVIRVLELEQNGSYLHTMEAKATKLYREIEDIIRFADFLWNYY